LSTAAASAQAQVNAKDYLKCNATKPATFHGTIVDAAVATPQLSVLVSLVSSAGLVDALSAPGNLTVFAPTNKAFEKVNPQVLAAIGGDNAELTKVLTYHVVAGKADPRRSLVPEQVKTLQGQTVFVGFDEDGASVNQSVASCTAVKTTNGTVWLVDSVLLPQYR
jgi:uncharacterized surface protein with fasciclin (FAS1) repeats